MSLEPGSSIGPYFIDREIGRGGMGVVYLAQDPRLQRSVAIKALPEHLAEEPSRLERFQSEAKALAQLNHPAVAGIHGLEEKDGSHYLILEYVEGQTLGEVLDRGALPVDEAVALGIRIAEGIEAAHEAGVIHRDLKPDNIHITAGGEVKILDFGLAKINQESSSVSGMTATVTSVQQNPTLPGVVLGTAAYMSPEQARGRMVDKRTDVWSFGVVLFECLTGTSPFAGESAGDSIGAVLHKDVDLDLLPDAIPPYVRRVLRRCLARDKNLRYRDIGDVRIELQSPDSLTPDAGAGRAPSRLPLLALAAVAVVAVAGWAYTALRSEPAAPAAAPLHLSISLPQGMEIVSSIDISRDGRMVVFAARDDEEQRVYLRSLDDFEMRPVQGSSDGVNPVFSPDGESIIFQARNRMLRAAVAGGPAVFLTDAKWMTADWSEDDTIVFSEGLNSPVVSMPAGGGERTPVTELAGDGAYAHVWPQRIGGTNKMLFTSWNSNNAGGARLFDMATGQILQVESGGEDRFVAPARWSPSGHLIFESWGAGLLVVPFDPESGQAVQRGEARPLLGEVAHMGNSTRSLFALSDEGTLVYAPGSQGRRRLVWVDATGGVEPILEQDRLQGAAIGGNLSLSPDGSRVALGGGGNVVVVDLDRNIPRSLDDPGNDLNMVWGGDGRIFYGSNRSERWSVWSVDPDGGAEPELVLQRDDNTWPRAVASNGDLLICETRHGFGFDLMILDRDGEVRPLMDSAANEQSGSFSVDDRWVAFDSDASGRFEVYVTRADGSGTPVQVTTDGGRAPKFGRSGETLYFRQHRRIMRVGFVDGRPVGEAVAVFQATNLATGTSYEISPDETRMIAVQLDDDAIPSELRVITDFFDVIHQVAGTTPPVD